MIKKATIRYICWECWHVSASHGKGMGTTTSYELYMDCASGKGVAAWKMDNPMTSCDFCLRLGDQMMKYDQKMDTIQVIHHSDLQHSYKRNTVLKDAKQMINQVKKTTLKPNIADGAAPTTTRNLQDTWHL
eukprot:13481333-Ditylum_brightwellii.AAC.1